MRSFADASLLGDRLTSKNDGGRNGIGPEKGVQFWSLVKPLVTLRICNALVSFGDLCPCGFFRDRFFKVGLDVQASEDRTAKNGFSILLK